jgi:hypothetical protein
MTWGRWMSKGLTACLICIGIVSGLVFVSGEDLSELPGDDEDIISYWNFDEGQGTNSSNQAQGPSMVLGTDLEAEDNDPAWKEGIKGTGLHFDGDDDVCTCPDFGFPTSELTISFWINTSWTVEGRVPFSYANIYETNEFMLEDPGDLKVHIRGLTKDTDVSINDGKWHHLAITWRGEDGDLRIYKDTEEVFKGLLAVETGIRSGGTLVLGNDQDEVGGGFDPDQSFNGTIDELMIMDIVLDSGDMEDLFEFYFPAPEAMNSYPDGGRHPVTTSVNITFNTEMDESTVEDAFTIDPEINGTFIWNGLNVSFVSDEDLEFDTEYRIGLSTDALDIWGRNLKEDLDFKFKTEKFVEPLQPSDDDDSDDDDDNEDGGDEENDNTTTVLIVLAFIMIGMIALIIALALISRLKENK